MTKETAPIPRSPGELPWTPSLWPCWSPCPRDKVVGWVCRIARTTPAYYPVTKAPIQFSTLRTFSVSTITAIPRTMCCLTTSTITCSLSKGNKPIVHRCCCYCFNLYGQRRVMVSNQELANTWLPFLPRPGLVTNCFVEPTYWKDLIVFQSKKLM